MPNGEKKGITVRIDADLHAEVSQYLRDHSMQTTLLFLGLLTFPDHMLLGLGIMLAANEVPRIAQQFGLDSSVKVNMMSVVHATTTAVNLTRSVARATGK